MTVFAHFTYPERELKGLLDGRIIKRHWDMLIKRLKRCYPSLQYAWVLEFQKNSMPHFHALFNCPIPKDLLARLWYEIVGTGLEKHLHAGTRIEFIRNRSAVADYLVLYLSKKDQKRVPEWFKEVGRFWGYSRGCIQKETYVLDAQNADFESVCRLKREIRVLKRWNRAHIRAWSKGSIRWKHKGSGFILWDGKAAFDQWLGSCGSRNSEEVPF
jgi:hypothetical protein